MLEKDCNWDQWSYKDQLQSGPVPGLFPVNRTGPQSTSLKATNKQSFEELLTMNDVDIFARNLETLIEASTSITSVVPESGGNSTFEETAQKTTVIVVRNVKLKEREKYVSKVTLMLTFARIANQSNLCITGCTNKVSV